MKYATYGLAAIIIAIVAFAIIEKVSPVSWGWWGDVNTKAGVALGGYDPVSYFEEGGPSEGSESFTHDWSGAIWQFSTADNKNRFVANPETYAPEFGGFCAFAVSKGFTANADPIAWHIHEGKLYVFADEKVREQWVNGVADGALQQSRTNWSKR